MENYGKPIAGNSLRQSSGNSGHLAVAIQSILRLSNLQTAESLPSMPVVPFDSDFLAFVECRAETNRIAPTDLYLAHCLPRRQINHDLSKKLFAMKRFAFLLLMLVTPGLASADDCCDCRCNHCGCQAPCQKVCRVVCEMKDVKVTCYCCKEEDICIPDHSKKCGEVCEPNPCCLAHPTECDACAGGQCCQHGCDRCHYDSFLDYLFGRDCCEKRTLWRPSCSGEIRNVNKLIKYEVTKQMPTYKWVVENCCDKCRCAIPADQLLSPPSAASTMPKQASAEIPDAPVAAPIPNRFVPPSDAKPAGVQATIVVDSEMWQRLSE